MLTKTTKTVLLTGFEAFGEYTVNPSELVSRELNGEVIAGHTISSLVLPVAYGHSADLLVRTINDVNPCLIICLGLAGNRTTITPERVAINLDNAEIPDNAGYQPIEKPIIQNGPVAYWSTLPVQEIFEYLKLNNIPVSLSLSAGTFVCNHVFYRMMHLLQNQPAIKAGFVHLPDFSHRTVNSNWRSTVASVTDATRKIISVCITACP